MAERRRRSALFFMELEAAVKSKTTGPALKLRDENVTDTISRNMELCVVDFVNHTGHTARATQFIHNAPY